MKDKEKAVGINTSDSKTLHSLQVAKMSSDVSKSNQLATVDHILYVNAFLLAGLFF